MGIRFGQRLSAERRRLALSVDQLSRGLCTPKQLSLLEAGQQEPTDRLVQSLAGALAPVQQLLPSLLAEAAWDVRDYADCALYAQSAARLALDSGDQRLWLEMTVLQSESLAAEGRFSEARDVLQLLLMDSDTGRESAAVQILLAQAFRALGELTTAIEHASEAVAVASNASADAADRAKALRELVAALTEAGRLDEARERCAELEPLITELPPQTAGEAHWSIGNTAFLTGDNRHGRDQHRHASELLLPLEDMRLWAQFNLDAASARLSAGVADADTQAMIEHAEIALAIAGGTDRDRALADLNRAHWLYLEGKIYDAALRLDHGRRRRADLGLRAAGDASMLHATIAQRLDSPGEALELFHEAHTRFADAGACAKARDALAAIVQLESLAEVAEGAGR